MRSFRGFLITPRTGIFPLIGKRAPLLAFHTKQVSLPLLWSSESLPMVELVFFQNLSASTK